MAKQRLTALDIRAIVTLCKKNIVGCIVTNIYNISNKIYVIKCSKKEQKLFFLVEAEKRIHITEWKREKDVMPSSFTMKLRKHLRSRKISNIKQLGADRVIDIQFGYDEKASHLIVELYIAGNIILTDENYKILSILKSNDTIMGRKYIVNDIYNVEEHMSVLLYKNLKGSDDKEYLKKCIIEILLYYNNINMDNLILKDGDELNNKVNNVNNINKNVTINNGDIEYNKMGLKNDDTEQKMNGNNNDSNMSGTKGQEKFKNEKDKNDKNDKSNKSSKSDKNNKNNKDNKNNKNKNNKNSDDINNVKNGHKNDNKVDNPNCSDNEKTKKVKKLKTLCDLACKLILFAHNDLIIHSFLECQVNPLDLLENYDINQLCEIFCPVIKECLSVLNKLSDETFMIKGYGFYNLENDKNKNKNIKTCNTNKKEIDIDKDTNNDDDNKELRNNNSIEKKEEYNFSEFSPIILKNHEMKINENKIKYISFDDYNLCVDTYFSKMELSKYDKQQEITKSKNAITKVDKIKLDHERRIDQLEKEVLLLKKKITLIQLNDVLIEEGIKLMRSALSTSANWEKIWEHIKIFKKQEHPIAVRIKSVNFKNCEMDYLLSDCDDKMNNKTDDDDDDENEENDDIYNDDNKKPCGANKKFAVTINLNNSVYGNIEDYQRLRKKAEEKIRKTKMATDFAVKKVEKKKKNKDNNNNNKQKGKVKSSVGQIQKLRKVYWFEKFHWFISSENYLVIAGRDALQNEILFRRYFQKNDIYVHADIHGAASCIIKNPYKDTPIPDKTLSEAGQLAICRSSAWNNKIITSAWWVYYNQVSKSAPSGEYLKTGSFVIRGKKNYLPHVKLEMGFCVLFQIEKDEELNVEDVPLEENNMDLDETRKENSKDDDMANNKMENDKMENIKRENIKSENNKMESELDNNNLNYLNNISVPYINEEDVVGITSDKINENDSAKCVIHKKFSNINMMEENNMLNVCVLRGTNENKNYNSRRICIKLLYDILSDDIFKKNVYNKFAFAWYIIKSKSSMIKGKKNRKGFNKYIYYFTRNKKDIYNMIYILYPVVIYNMLRRMNNPMNIYKKKCLDYIYVNKFYHTFCKIIKYFFQIYNILITKRNSSLEKESFIEIYKYKNYIINTFFKGLKGNTILVDSIYNFLIYMDSIFYDRYKSSQDVNNIFSLSYYNKDVEEDSWGNIYKNVYMEDNINGVNKKMLNDMMEYKENYDLSNYDLSHYDYAINTCMENRFFVACEVYGRPVTFKDDSDEEINCSEKKNENIINEEDVNSLCSSYSEVSETEKGNKKGKKKNVTFVCDDENKEKCVSFNMERNDDNVNNDKKSNENVSRPFRSRKGTGYVKMDMNKLLKDIEEDDDDEKKKQVSFKRKGITSDVIKRTVSFSSEEEHICVEQPASLYMPRPVRTRKATGFVKMDMKKLLDEIGVDDELNDENIESDENKFEEKGKKVTFQNYKNNDAIKKSVSFSSEEEYIPVDEPVSLKVTRPVRSRKATGFVKMDVSKLLQQIGSDDHNEEMRDDDKKEKKVTFKNKDISSELDKKSTTAYTSEEDHNICSKNSESSPKFRSVRSRKPTGFVKMDVSKLLREVEYEKEEDDGRAVRFDNNMRSNDGMKKTVSFSSEEEYIPVNQSETVNNARPVRTRKATGFVKVDMSKLLKEVEQELEEEEKEDDYDDVVGIEEKKKKKRREQLECDIKDEGEHNNNNNNNSDDDDNLRKDNKKVTFNDKICDLMNRKIVSFSSEEEHIPVDERVSLNMVRPVRTRKPTGFVNVDVSKLLMDIGSKDFKDEDEEKSDDESEEKSEEQSEEQSEDDDEDASEEYSVGKKKTNYDNNNNNNVSDKDGLNNSGDDNSYVEDTYGNNKNKTKRNKENDTLKKSVSFECNENKNKNNVHLLRGARTKKKRMKKKYKEQEDDEESRALHMKIIGSKMMKHEIEKPKKKEEELKPFETQNKYKGPKEVITNYEKINEDDMDIKLNEIHKLTNSPSEGDNLSFAIPMCAPYSAIQTHKYKIKLVPGNTKKGKVADSCISYFLKNATNEKEKELIKNISMDELGNCIIANCTPDLKELKELSKNNFIGKGRKK
ncbi:conserved protein, unknown function [Plasmodium sp. gorilla clade G2]|uniref:conserved protein, unknown function n=1 Tax=Plasmodium sp. gorilla clade G2 TaxID=880535 RepID=UPI000D21F2DE|nr:conserved protein, unknown function [Plasmodium sp. gorilla clade G2]SOV16455.1 conserved protein, unknown function [Plasmodium sp. gorilla clade G2]